MHFGKRLYLNGYLKPEKKDFDREFMHFGKRGGQFERDFMSFGR